MPTSASKEKILHTIANLTDEEKVALWRMASQSLFKTRFSGPADLFSETVDRMLGGARHWPLHVPFLVYMRAAMASVADTDRKRHGNARAHWTPIDEMLDMSCQMDWGAESAEQRLIQKERVEIAIAATRAALEAMKGDADARLVMHGWLDGMDREELCEASGMEAGAYDSARKRALRAIRKLVPQSD